MSREEQRLSAYIRHELLTQEQQDWFARHQLEPLDLVHMTYPGTLEHEAAAIRRQWNETAGHRFFAENPLAPGTLENVHDYLLNRQS